MKNPVEGLREKLIGSYTERAVLIYSQRNRRYMTGFNSTDGVLIITADEAYLLVDFRYAEAAGKEARNCKVVEFTGMNASICEILKKHGVREVLLEAEEVSYARALRLKSVCADAGAAGILDASLDGAIRSLRMIKTPEEIKKIEASQEITDAAFEYVLPRIKEGVSERDIALDIEFFMRKNGAESVAFDLIVVSGKNGSLCHGVPSDKKIMKGEFITMDTGAVLDGYYSDMTRTVALGSVSAEQIDIYDTVLKAQLASTEAVKPGVRCCEIDRIAREIIETPYPGTFGHALGHGVGADIHEWPVFAAADRTVLKPGMVVTDEPGIYIAGKHGVRIEDMLLVTEDGCRSLTKSPKDLIIL